MPIFNIGIFLTEGNGLDFGKSIDNLISFIDAF